MHGYASFGALDNQDLTVGVGFAQTNPFSVKRKNGQKAVGIPNKSLKSGTQHKNQNERNRLYIYLMHFRNTKERKEIVAFDAILVGWQ